MQKLTLQQKKQKILDILTLLKVVFFNAKTELIFTQDYELLFAVIMSAQTTDVQVNKVTNKLFREYPTLESFARADITNLTEAISSINYYRNKAKHIHTAAQQLLKDFDGKVPHSLSDLQMLPGVGRKTANVMQRELFGEDVEGIAVDTHVMRLSRQLGLTTATTPEKIEIDLMLITPKHEWAHVSNLLILYGRYYWKARQEDKGTLTKHLIQLGW